MLPGGDFNDDNQVSTPDYLALRNQWMTSAPEGDINGDGNPDLKDRSP